MSKNLLIALSGYARAGKDTLAKLIEKKYKDSVTVSKFSFAFALKSDLKSLLLERFNVDPFTEDNELKTIIRPLLISYGTLARELSNGTYWWKKVKSEIDDFFSKENGIAIVTDLRFNETDNDELNFIKNYDNSLVVAVERDNIGPAHITEEKNYPSIREKSDIIIKWPSINQESDYNQYTKDLFDLIDKKLYE